MGGICSCSYIVEIIITIIIITIIVHVRFWAKPTFDLDTTTYSVNGKPIKQFLQHKDLGIIFSSNLNWTNHYQSITAKAYKILGLIRRTFKINCIEAKKQLYISLIRSQIMYCSQLWRPQLIRDINILERVQRRAIQNLYSITTFHHIKQDYNN